MVKPNPGTKFEKSKKDKETKGIKEGSKREEFMDRMMAKDKKIMGKKGMRK